MLVGGGLAATALIGPGAAVVRGEGPALRDGRGERLAVAALPATAARFGIANAGSSAPAVPTTATFLSGVS